MIDTTATPIAYFLKTKPKKSETPWLSRHSFRTDDKHLASALMIQIINVQARIMAAQARIILTSSNQSIG